MSPKAGSPNVGKTVHFAYDHKGRRVRKFVDTVGTGSSKASIYFYGLGGSPLEVSEALSSGETRERTWVWAGTRLVAMESHSTSPSGTGSHQYMLYHNDHLGRPVAVTDLQGIPLWRSKALAYGKDAGYDLKDDPFEEITATMEKTPYGANENHVHTASIIKPGTFGIQFYFEKLSLETNYESSRAAG